MKVQLITLLLFAAAAALPAYPGEAEDSSPSPSPLSAPSPPAVSPTPGIPAQEVSGGFIRYIPNREGDYEWKMEGESVTFLSPVSLEINLLTATALDPQLEGLIIEAAKVHYFTDSGIARNGEARITVRRENMVLTGKGFLWTPQNRQIRVFEDVRLLIKEGGGGGLFPL
jgi:hypothetical protein